MPKRKKQSFYPAAQPILLAVDCIIFGFDQKEGLKLLLFKRKVATFKNKWSVIGSFVQPIEDVEEAANRILEESTGLTNRHMEPLGCYGKTDRDPGGRVVSQAYFSLIRLEEKEEQSVEEYQAKWFSLDEIPQLILDHNEMVADALVKLRRKARYRPIGFELLAEKFTLPQLQQLYEAIYQKPLDRRNFRKKIIKMEVLEKLEEKDKSTSKKGAFLYRFVQERYKAMIEKGIDFVV